MLNSKILSLFQGKTNCLAQHLSYLSKRVAELGRPRSALTPDLKLASKTESNEKKKNESNVLTLTLEEIGVSQTEFESKTDSRPRKSLT